MTLSALNNKAQIHYENLEYTSAGDCMTEITSIMNVVPEIHLTMSPKDIEGLFLNVMLMIMNPPTVARAA